MDNDKMRIVLAIICGLIIISLGLYLIFNWREVFVNKVEIMYPDGCIEKFENGVAVSPICTHGRLLQEEQERKYIDSNINQQINPPTFDFYNVEE